MIEVTRLDGSALVVNVDLIEWIERTPDTVVSLVNGEKLRVRETPSELVRRVVAYKRAIHAVLRPVDTPTTESELDEGGVA